MTGPVQASWKVCQRTVFVREARAQLDDVDARPRRKLDREVYRLEDHAGCGNIDDSDRRVPRNPGKEVGYQAEPVP
jgi:hypothetical protein